MNNEPKFELDEEVGIIPAHGYSNPWILGRIVHVTKVTVTVECGKSGILRRFLIKSGREYGSSKGFFAAHLCSRDAAVAHNAEAVEKFARMKMITRISKEIVGMDYAKVEAVYLAAFGATLRDEVDAARTAEVERVSKLVAEKLASPDVGCEEASAQSKETFGPCGRPATKLILSERGRVIYRMCNACADHNVKNRQAKDVTG